MGVYDSHKKIKFDEKYFNDASEKILRLVNEKFNLPDDCKVIVVKEKD